MSTKQRRRRRSNDHVHGLVGNLQPQAGGFTPGDDHATDLIPDAPLIEITSTGTYAVVEDKELEGAALSGGGTGYTDNDVLTLVGGTGTAATVTVDGVTAGVIDALDATPTTRGDYSVDPTSPAGVTGGSGGDDALVTFTLQAKDWQVTRASGSFITDGFVVGMRVRISSVLNVDIAATIVALTATVMTLTINVGNVPVTEAATTINVMTRNVQVPGDDPGRAPV